MPDQTIDPGPRRYQCCHIFTEGRRCGSPSLRGEQFCYYHHTTRRPIRNPGEPRTPTSGFDLPLPEDRGAVQRAIGEVLQRVASREVDHKTAALLLYGLQIASHNLPRFAAPKPSESQSGDAPVEEVVSDPRYGILAPCVEIAEPTGPAQPVSALPTASRPVLFQHGPVRRPSPAASESAPEQEQAFPSSESSALIPSPVPVQEQTRRETHQQACEEDRNRSWEEDRTRIPMPPHLAGHVAERAARTKQSLPKPAGPPLSRSVFRVPDAPKTSEARIGVLPSLHAVAVSSSPPRGARRATKNPALAGLFVANPIAGVLGSRSSRG